MTYGINSKKRLISGGEIDDVYIKTVKPAGFTVFLFLVFLTQKPPNYQGFWEVGAGDRNRFLLFSRPLFYFNNVSKPLIL